MDIHIAASSESSYMVQALILKKASLGKLLEKPDVIASALDSVVTMKSLEPTESNVSLFLENNRHAQLEKWVKSRMLANPRRRSSENPAALVRLYEAAGRPEDAVRILEEYAGWNEEAIEFAPGASLEKWQLAAAKALIAVGRKDEGLRIVKAGIRANPNVDEWYAVLLEHDRGNMAGFLDGLAADFPFEERPLIWKAKILGDAGNLAEGEIIIRKAIAMDPSDGEQGKIDRMRAYRVLGEILVKQGKDADAAFMEKIDIAIRRSEDADDWWVAGLTKKALEIYQESLESFADAYCIQSRLALRYSERGDMERATLHYQKAFELMPESFGRIESHCFGCEGAFSSDAAQAIAEKIFTTLAEKPGAKPQVFYLLGYLRMSQERYGEAVEFFGKAVELDPDYVNAWLKLSEIAGQAGLSPEVSDQAILALERLTKQAPLEKLSTPALAWRHALAREAAGSGAAEEAIFPLAAARKRIAREVDEGTGDDGDMDLFFIKNEYSRRSRNPRAVLERHPWVSALISSFTNLRND